MAVILAGDAPEDCPWDAAYLAAAAAAVVAAASADPAPKDTAKAGHQLANSNVYTI